MTRRLLGTITAGLLVLAVSACSSDGDSTDAASAEPTTQGEVVRMWIAPEKAECTGVGPMECLQVAYTEDGTPELFYSEIVGFEFAEGTSYVIDVEVTDVPSPPADASSLAYTLVEVVSQTPAP